MSDPNVRHVLGLSGGRDSAALAVFMRQHHPEIELDYFFTDTGKELPEVYEYLVSLEGSSASRSNGSTPIARSISGSPSTRASSRLPRRAGVRGS